MGKNGKSPARRHPNAYKNVKKQEIKRKTEIIND